MLVTSIFSFSHNVFYYIKHKHHLSSNIKIATCECSQSGPSKMLFLGNELYRGYLFFSVKGRNLFHRVDTIGNIFTSGANQIFCLFHAFNPFWEKLYQNAVQFFSVIPRGVPLPHSSAFKYYVKREKYKVNDVTFPSGYEARAIKLGNKNMEIGIFNGGTSVRSKTYFH